MSIIGMLSNAVSRIFYKLFGPRLRVEHAVLSGDGSFIDIRYTLSRPDKSTAENTIYLMQDETNAKFRLMRLAKCGIVRTRHSKNQFSGIMLFYNRGMALSSGAYVTLHFGSLIAQDIMVS